MVITNILNKYPALVDFKYWYLILALLSGAGVALGFAPFHLPGAAILSLAIFYKQIQTATLKQTFIIGLIFGLGFMGVGISWINVSIHNYGHLNLFISLSITTLLIF